MTRFYKPPRPQGKINQNYTKKKLEIYFMIIQ
jgi:hypothetical protein